MGRVVVIGSGLAGLSTAIRLGAAGHRVIVFEQGDEPGGRLNRIQLGDLFFDAEPDHWLLPHLLADLFASASQRLDDYLDFLPLKPACRFLFAEGESFDLWSDPERLRDEIKRISPEDVSSVDRFLFSCRAAFKALNRGLWQRILDRPYDPLLSLLRPASLIRIPWLLNPERAWSSARRHWKNPRLQQAFGWSAMECGSSPLHAPAALNWPVYALVKFGAWYPRGGPYGLRRALLRLLDRLAIEVRCGEPIEEIVVLGGRARGVVTKGGHSVEAHAVVAAADSIALTRSLVTSRDPHLARLHNRWEHRESSFARSAFLLACNRDWPKLAHRTVLFSDDPAAEYQPLREWAVPAPEPTFTLVHPARTDPEIIPRGRAAITAWFAAPALSHRWRWKDENRFAYRTIVLDRMEKRGLEGVRAAIDDEREMPPDVWRETFGTWRGAAWGLATHSLKSLFHRFPNCHPLVSRLFFVGRAAHPGPTHPQVVIGSRLVAQRVIQELRGM